MIDRKTNQSTELLAVLEQRATWLRAAQEAERTAADGQVSPFVRDVIERYRKLRYELAADRYFNACDRHASS